jgi:Phd_YefM.
MGTTNFVSFRELRTSTAKINDMLTEDGKIIVTSKGKPKAIMIQVNESDFEETLSILNQIKLTKTISNIRATAQQNGSAEMTMEEIDAEIAQYRKEKHERLAKGENND